MTREATLADPRPTLDGAALKALALRLDQSDMVLQTRTAALDLYRSAALPDRVKHLWRFSNPENLLPSGLAAADICGPSAAPELIDPVAEAVATVDLWPGRAPVVQRVSADPVPGLEVKPLTVETVAAGTPRSSALFRHLNEAAWNAGLVIEVAAGTVLPGPVVVRIHAGGSVVIPRILFKIGPQAEATLVEQHVGGSADAVVVSRTGVEAGAAANVRHVVLQTWEPGTKGHISVHSTADRDSDVLTAFATFGGERAKMELVTDLSGPGARSEMIGVALAGDGQRFDHHTRHRHVSGRTWSNIDFKTVGAGRSRGSYTGLIRIEEGARVTEAYQVNRNLLLSAKSRADAIPELEILNEEVSCSHGATVAPVDPDQLFYLESRGMDPHVALRLVVRGFLEKTLQSLPAVLRPAVEELMEARLAGLKENA